MAPDNFALHWKTVDNTITFAIDMDGLIGWLSLSTSEAGRKGVDSGVLIRGNSAGTWLLRDYWAESNIYAPVLDQAQSLTLLQLPVQDTNNRTFAIFSRALDPCDAEDVIIQYGVSNTVFYAYGSNWGADSANLQGVPQGSKRMMLWPVANATAPASPTDAVQLNLTVPVPSIGAARTTVVCMDVALPADRPYHITRFEGILSSALVHHTALYGCSFRPGTLDQTYDCSMSGPSAGCESLRFIWGRGTQPYITPAEAAFPMGAGAMQYATIQVHYDNPDALIQQGDNSGLSLTYTAQLRANDMAVLKLGSTNITIPPLQSAYSLVPNQCPGACTAAHITPNATINLVSSFFYMKSLGKTIRTRHFRSGAALQPVGVRTYYDESAMVYTEVSNGSRQLQGGDTLLTRCIYNSSAIQYNTTFFGPAGNQEVCTNYLMYWPAVNVTGLDVCMANDAKGYASCSTERALAAFKANATNDTVLLQRGLLTPVTSLNITPWRSAICKARDDLDFIPDYIYNFKSAFASIVLVPAVLCLVGYIIFMKYNKEEEIMELLASLKSAEVQASIMEALREEEELESLQKDQAQHNHEQLQHKQEHHTHSHPEPPVTFSSYQSQHRVASVAMTSASSFPRVDSSLQVANSGQPATLDRAELPDDVFHFAESSPLIPSHDRSNNGL
ncbi:MAG: hypothetical protein WDW36_000307 [Sanguina aurantia]